MARFNPDERLRKLTRDDSDLTRQLLEKERAQQISKSVIRAAAFAGQVNAIQLYPELSPEGKDKKFAVQNFFSELVTGAPAPGTSSYGESAPVIKNYSNIKLAFKACWNILTRTIDVNNSRGMQHSFDYVVLVDTLGNWFRDPEVNFISYIQNTLGDAMQFSEHLHTRITLLRELVRNEGYISLELYRVASFLLSYLQAVLSLFNMTILDTNADLWNIVQELTDCFIRVAVTSNALQKAGENHLTFSQALQQMGNVVLEIRKNPAGDITAALQGSYKTSYSSTIGFQKESKKEKLLLGLWEAYRATDDKAAQRIILNKITKLAPQVYARNPLKDQKLFHGSPYSSGIIENFSDFELSGGVLFLSPCKHIAQEYTKPLLSAGKKPKKQVQDTPVVYTVQINIEDDQIFDTRNPAHLQIYKQLRKQIRDEDPEAALDSLMQTPYIPNCSIQVAGLLPSFGAVHVLKRYLKDMGFRAAWISEGSQGASLALFNPNDAVVLEQS